MISCTLNLKLLSRSLFTNLKRFSSTKDNLPPAQSIGQLLDEAFVAENNQQAHQRTEPEHENVILFPGQGSLKVGMVRDLLKYKNVPEMFDAASQIFGADILKYCQSGPQSELQNTYINQPAVFLASLAGIERVQVLIFSLILYYDILCNNFYVVIIVINIVNCKYRRF